MLTQATFLEHHLVPLEIAASTVRVVVHRDATPAAPGSAEARPTLEPLATPYSPLQPLAAACSPLQPPSQPPNHPLQPITARHPLHPPHPPPSLSRPLGTLHRNAAAGHADE